MKNGLELIGYGLATIILCAFSYTSSSVIIKFIFMVLAIGCLVKSTMIGIPSIKKMIKSLKKKG